MPSLLCAHVPWLRLKEYRSYLLEKRINPELYIPAEAIDTMDRELLRSFAGDLSDSGLSCTIHGTFMDLNPGSVDRAVRETTCRRVEQTLEIASFLKPRVIVFHPGYSRISYGSAIESWVANSVAFWKQHLPALRDLDTIVALENIFEEEPSTLRMVLDSLDDPRIRHCFDSGHFNMFATVTVEEWFSTLGSYIAESHLHDNHGVADEHLPVGEGEINFDLVTTLLKQYAPQAVWTLEAHSVERLERSMASISRYCQD
jgi:sugar phosphate isomerase/epimerase